MKKAATYEVTLRRDVQQIARVRVQAYSRQEAVGVAESVSDDAAWNVEEHIGTHEPQVQVVRAEPVRGRETSKADRRGGADRRADRRRLGDKSRALVAERGKKRP